MSLAITSAIRGAMGSPITSAMGLTALTYLYDFDGTSITTASSIRELVDSGTNGVNATLNTGQGIHFQSTQYLDTGYMVPHDAPYTYGFEFVLTTPSTSRRLTGSGQTGHRLHAGQSNNSTTDFICILGSDAAYTNIVTGKSVGESLRVVITFDGTDTYNVYFDDNQTPVYTTTNAPTAMSTYSLILGGYELGGSFSSANSLVDTAREFFLIEDVVFTGAEVAQYYNNPESLAYYVAGSLTSDFASLTAPILSNLESGIGGWRYLLSENSTANDGGGNYYAMNSFQYTAFSVANGELLVGVNSAVYYTNADELTVGYQNALVTRDSYGVPTGLASINWKAQTVADLVSQALSENSLTAVVVGDPATQIDIFEA